MIEQKIDELLSESVIDWRRGDLPQDVWDKEGKEYNLKPDLKNRILQILEELPDALTDRVWIIGSIASKHYNSETDIDVHLLPSVLPDEMHKGWANKVKNLNTNHGSRPLQFYLHKENVEPYADSIYDVNKDTWEKFTELKAANLKNYYKKFKDVVGNLDLSKAELYRDLVDYKVLDEALKDADPELQEEISSELQEKLDEINLNVDGLISEIVKAKDRRTQALYDEFNDELDGDYSKAVSNFKQLLPDNVIYKLLERYHYKRFVSKLREFKKNFGDVDGIDDVERSLEIF